MSDDQMDIHHFLYSLSVALRSAVPTSADFLLLVFNYGKPKTIGYTASVDREDVLRMLDAARDVIANETPDSGGKVGPVGDS